MSFNDLISQEGKTIGDKVSHVKNKFGKNSIEAVTAEAKAIDAIVDTRKVTIQENVPNKWSERNKYLGFVADKVDEIVKVSNSDNNYLQFRTEEECDRYFKNHLEFWKNASSEPEGSLLNESYESMKSYTGIDYNLMNKMLREENIVDGISANNIKVLSDTLEQFTLKDDIILYRGIDDINFLLTKYGITPSDNLDNDLKFLTGGVLTIPDNAFVSTTPIMGRGFTHKQIVEVIKAPAGTKGSYVGNESSVKGECEFLLQAGEFNKSSIQSVEKIGEQIFIYVQLLN